MHHSAKWKCWRANEEIFDIEYCQLLFRVWFWHWYNNPAAALVGIAAALCIHPAVRPFQQWYYMIRYKQSNPKYCVYLHLTVTLKIWVKVQLVEQPCGVLESGQIKGFVSVCSTFPQVLNRWWIGAALPMTKLLCCSPLSLSPGGEAWGCLVTLSYF